MHTLEQIKKEKSVDKLYDMLDAELEGQDRPGIVTAISERIEKIENLLLDMQTGAIPISEGYDA